MWNDEGSEWLIRIVRGTASATSLLRKSGFLQVGVIRTMPIGPVSWETGNWRRAGSLGGLGEERLGVGCEPRRRRAD
jgi:hypothetical protein